MPILYWFFQGAVNICKPTLHTPYPPFSIVDHNKQHPKHHLVPCSTYGSATERVSRKRGWVLELLEIEDGLVLHAYPVSYEFRYGVEIMLIFTLLRFVFCTAHLYPSTCSVIQHPLTGLNGLQYSFTTSLSPCVLTSTSPIN